MILEDLFLFKSHPQFAARCVLILVLTPLRNYPHKQSTHNINSTTIATAQQYSHNNQDHTIQTTRINHTTISIINNTILKMITLNYDKMMGRKYLIS